MSFTILITYLTVSKTNRILILKYDIDNKISRVAIQFSFNFLKNVDIRLIIKSKHFHLLWYVHPAADSSNRELYMLELFYKPFRAILRQ